MHNMGMKRLHRVSIAFGGATVLASVAALSLDKSLPYRIGLVDYSRYMWVGRLVGISVGFALLALLCGLAARKGWFSVGLSLLGLTPLLFMGGVLSGPNPQAWCFNNLRLIEGAKEQLARERGPTNGSPVTMADISRLIPAGRELRCAEGGTYIINSIGSDARCTIHGAIPEMEAAWQWAMRAQPDGASNRSQPLQLGTNSTSLPAGSGR